MKTKLEELTIGQFIDLVCGDTSVLKGKHEIVSQAKVVDALRNIVFEYKEITDQAGMRGYLSTVEELLKAKMTAVLFYMCNNLVALEEYDRLRDVLAEYGVHSGSMNDRRVVAEVTSQLERAKRTIAQINEESHSDKAEVTNIRRTFDEQTAALMAYFKFQIDTNTMKATVYAHLIARHNREIKAQLASMKKK